MYQKRNIHVTSAAHSLYVLISLLYPTLIEIIYAYSGIIQPGEMEYALVVPNLSCKKIIFLLLFAWRTNE